MTTPQEERDAALAGYRQACAEFDAAQAQWDPFVDFSVGADIDSDRAESAFRRLKLANQAKQDALDSLWLAWRNRPE